MKVFFANTGFFEHREFALRSRGANRLVSYADPQVRDTVIYYQKPLVEPPERKKSQ